MDFQHITTPCGDERYYKNIDTCSVTLPIISVIQSHWWGRNHNDEYGVIELSVNMAALTIRGALRQQRCPSESRLQLWCCNWNFTKDLFETKTRCCLSEADRLLSFFHSMISLFLSGCFMGADVLSVEIILQVTGAYPGEDLCSKTNTE